MALDGMSRPARIAVMVGAAAGVLLVAGVIGLYVLTGMRMSADYHVEVEKLVIPTGTAAVERGRHIAWAVSKCVACHGEDLGGSVFSEGPTLGRLAAANLTRGRGGAGTDFGDVDWVRAIRHGIGSDSEPLIFMPAHEFYLLSDTDLVSLIAYLKSVKPVDRDMPPSKAGLASRVHFLTGRLTLIPAEVIDHTGPRPKAPVPGVNAAYGEYLVNVGGCRKCHGPNLTGGPVPFAPAGTVASANLAPGGDIDDWTEEEFFTALRLGREPDGGNLEEFMPWKYTAGLTDDEIRAIWLYLQSL